jgi:hypothetical protein
MVYTPDVGLRDIILSLNPLIGSHAEGSKEREVLVLAQLALLYIRDKEMQEGFASYCEGFTNESFAVEVSHEFATREEAEKWLASGKARHAEHVRIAGKGFLVVQLPEGMTLMDMPLPEELETDEWKDDSDEEGSG